MSWETKRVDPYTEIGISRLKCIRCGAKAKRQWQVCSDGNNYRPVCIDCDIALNKAVLLFMKHPYAKQLSSEYEESLILT